MPSWNEMRNSFSNLVQTSHSHGSPDKIELNQFEAFQIKVYVYTYNSRCVYIYAIGSASTRMSVPSLRFTRSTRGPHRPSEKMGRGRRLWFSRTGRGVVWCPASAERRTHRDDAVEGEEEDVTHNLLLKYPDVALTTYVWRQMKHLKHVSKTLAKHT
jgi:hypothetical protein